MGADLNSISGSWVLDLARSDLADIRSHRRRRYDYPANPVLSDDFARRGVGQTNVYSHPLARVLVFGGAAQSPDIYGHSPVRTFTRDAVDECYLVFSTHASFFGDRAAPSPTPERASGKHTNRTEQTDRQTDRQTRD